MTALPLRPRSGGGARARRCTGNPRVRRPPVGNEPSPARPAKHRLSLLSAAGVAEWQTQGTQNPPLARACRFESGLRHQGPRDSAVAEPASVLQPVFLDLVVDGL